MHVTTVCLQCMIPVDKNRIIKSLILSKNTIASFENVFLYVIYLFVWQTDILIKLVQHVDFICPNLQRYVWIYFMKRHSDLQVVD